MTEHRLQPTCVNTLAFTPGKERDRAWHLSCNLCGLRRYVDNFHAALRLADHAEALAYSVEPARAAAEVRATTDPAHFPDLQYLGNEKAKFQNWVAIAARDAAFSVDHFEHLFRRIREGARRLTSLADIISWQHLKAAGRSFDESFPRYRQIRDAIGHDSERGASRHEVAEFGFSGHYQGPGVSINGSKNLTMTINSGRTIQYTWKNEIVSISITEKSFNDLVHVEQQIYMAFQPLEAALRHKDLGD